MVPFPIYLAARYIRPKRSFISLVSAISVVGVLLGVFILVVVLSVMTGFDNMWRDKILSFKPHLTVTGVHGVILDEEEVSRRIDAVPGVTGVAPVITTLALMQRDGRVTAPMVVGIDARRAGQVTRVADHMYAGAFDLGYGRFVAGLDLAAGMGLAIDERCLLYTSRNVLARDQLHLPEELELAGVFDMGMRDYDSRFVLTSLDSARDLTGMTEGVEAIYVMTDDPFRFAAYAADVEEALGGGFVVRTWRDEDSVLFAALSNEKSMMFVLLVFISIVAAFCIACVMIVVTVHKTNEIGLLKALGFDGFSVMGVFVLYGMVHSLVGTALGVGLGVLASRHLNEIAGVLSRFNVEVFPKEIYGLSRIPADTQPGDVWTIVISVLALSAVASVLSSLRAASISPAEALRHE